jgi:hypothetical protein
MGDVDWAVSVLPMLSPSIASPRTWQLTSIV